jgi:hypothetical protein
MRCIAQHNFIGILISIYLRDFTRWYYVQHKLFLKLQEPSNSQQLYIAREMSHESWTLSPLLSIYIVHRIYAFTAKISSFDNNGTGYDEVNTTYINF